MTRYLSGLCVAGLGLCGGGWLVVAAVAFRGESGGRAGRVNVLTGAALVAVCCLSLVCWSCAWRRRLRADGVLADRFPLVSRREARRSRRARGRDERRTARLAERSARGARRAARRAARLTAGGALGEAGAASVLGEGVALGVAAGGDEQYATAEPALAVPAPAAAPVVAGDEGKPGELATELISEIRSMLEPLLAATGGQPMTLPPPAAPLPRRSPFASDLRPRPRLTAAELAAPRVRPAPGPSPRPTPRSIPRLAPGFGPADTTAGTWTGASTDEEDAWW